MDVMALLFIRGILLAQVLSFITLQVLQFLEQCLFQSQRSSPLNIFLYLVLSFGLSPREWRYLLQSIVDTVALLVYSINLSISCNSLLLWACSLYTPWTFNWVQVKFTSSAILSTITHQNLLFIKLLIRMELFPPPTQTLKGFFIYNSASTQSPQLKFIFHRKSRYNSILLSAVFLFPSRPKVKWSLRIMNFLLWKNSFLRFAVLLSKGADFLAMTLYVFSQSYLLIAQSSQFFEGFILDLLIMVNVGFSVTICQLVNSISSILILVGEQIFQRYRLEEDWIGICFPWDQSLITVRCLILVEVLGLLSDVGSLLLAYFLGLLRLLTPKETFTI